jgi:hypothetical protein
MLVEAFDSGVFTHSSKEMVHCCINGDPKLKDKIGSEFAPNDPKSLCFPSKH